jgi:hypothetical protein
MPLSEKQYRQRVIMLVTYMFYHSRTSAEVLVSERLPRSFSIV